MTYIKNMKRSNIIQDADLFSHKVLILGLDIHKAFNNVLWSYIDTCLAKFGFSGEFVNGFKALYRNPHTQIRLPGCSSEYFPWAGEQDKVAFCCL